MPFLAHKMLLEHQEEYVKCIFVRSSNHVKFFYDFCKIQA